MKQEQKAVNIRSRKYTREELINIKKKYQQKLRNKIIIKWHTNNIFFYEYVQLHILRVYNCSHFTFDNSLHPLSPKKL